MYEIAERRYEIEIFFKHEPSPPSVNPYKASLEQVGPLKLPWKDEVPTEHVTTKLTRIKHVVKSRSRTPKKNVGAKQFKSGKCKAKLRRFYDEDKEESEDGEAEGAQRDFEDSEYEKSDNNELLWTDCIEDLVAKDV